MPKLYSWITVPPETVVKGKALPSHPLFPGLGSGTGAGLVPFHEFQCQKGAPVRAGWVIQAENLIPRPLLPKKRPCWPQQSGMPHGWPEVAMAVAGGSSSDPISCRSPAAAPEPKANPCRQRGGKGPKSAPFPDGRGPSVPSVLDIPAEPFRRSPLAISHVLPAARKRATAWGHSCCRCQGEPVLGDTATPHLSALAG